LITAVIGISDPEIGKIIKTFIILNEDYVGKIFEAEVMNWAKEHLVVYKYPR
jgi:fatty-acyl-CoA synthase